MKKLSGILAIIILATRLLAQAGFVSQAPVLRVALMDFVSEDNSYRSTVALGNLVSALQAEVSQDTNYDWVERAELEKAANELKLAGLGLIDRSEAIRGGCWVKADWGIFGDISTNSNGHRMLSLEIVNLQRADVLAETNLSLPMADSGQFQIKSEYVSNIASTLRTLLNHARKVYSGSEKQDAVAFLFLSLAQGGLSDALGDLDADFRHSLFIASTNSQRFHLVQFQRAGAAMDEANLVLSGLAEDDSNAWEKVADRYVWGDARVDDRKTFDWETKNWRDERKLEVKLNVWDGRGEPQVIALTVTNETSEALARELTQAIEPLLRRDGAKPIVDNMRSRISDSLFARYSGLPINFWFDSPEGRRQWLDAVQLLETACFFNPGNAAAREQLLRLRWGTALLDYNAGSPAAREELERLSLTQGLKSASRNEFFFVRRRSEAWGKYVEQFGFKTALAKSNSPSITAEYVLSAWRPFEMFVSGQYNQAQGGVPRDAGLREVTEWQNQFGSEFISRLLKAPDQFSGMYRDALHEYFQENGQPGSEQKLLAQLKEANRGEKSAPANGPPPTGQVRLPRIAELESELAQTGDIFSVRPMMFSPPLVEPNIKTIPFPSDARVKGVKSMIFHGDTLWLAVEVAEPLEIKTLNGQIEKEFQPVLADHIRLWKLGANAQKLEPVTGSLATNDVNSMMFRNNTLWLALNDEGIAALDVKTGELQRYGSSAGIVSTNQFALADISRGIVAIGGMNDLLFLENEMKTWKHFDPGLPHQDFLFGAELRQIAGLKDKLLLYNSQLLCCDLKLNTWTQIADPPSLDRMGRIHSMTGDGRDNFWIASDSGLHGVDPYIGRIRSQWIPVSPAVQAAESPTYPGQVQPRKNDAQLVREIRQKLELRRRLLAARKMDPNQPNLFVPGSRLPAGILSVTADDDFLWVFTVDTMRPLLYHPASHDWVGGFYIRRMGTPSTLACGGGKLWLATRPGENFAILEMDTSTLKSTPREHWLPEAVSSEELAARVSDLSEHERAVFLFFSGNDEAVIKLLQARPEDELDPESLFLLSSAFSEIGQPDRAGYFEKKLVGNFPGNIFATFISSGQRLQETRTKIEGRLKESPQPESPGAKAVSAWMTQPTGANSVPTNALVNESWISISNRWGSVPLGSIKQAAGQGEVTAQYYLGVAYFDGNGVIKDQGEAFKWMKLAAQGGTAKAQRMLGWMLQNGLGTASNMAEAAEWYHKAAQQGDAQAQMNLGRMYEIGAGIIQDYAEAARFYRLAADQGHAMAQNNLGWLYKNGWGVPQNPDDALKWFGKSAEQGEVLAQINLGWMYAQGDLDKRDYDLAEKWLRKAAAQGSPEAQYQFGCLLTEEFDKTGHQIANFVVAAEWYRKAAEQGHAKAQYELASMYHGGELGDDQRSNCIPWFLKAAAQGNAEAQAIVGELPKFYPNSELLKNVDTIAPLRQSAKSGNLEAQFQLASRYQTGDGVSKDPSEAFKWMQKAAQQEGGSSSVVGDARYQLGLMYEKGEGVAPDLIKAHELFRSAIEESMYAGRNPAILRLGQMYERGEDVPQSDRKAVEYYSQGYPENLLNLYVQDRGLPEDKAKVGQQIIYLRGLINTARGCFFAGEIYYQGKLVPKDIAQAADWFNKAAAQGSPEAMNRIGEMWAAGLNGAPDPKEAANWFHKGAAKGLAEAQYNFGLCYAKGAGVPTDSVEAWKWLQLAAEQKFPKAAEERDKIQATMTADQIKSARTLADQINAAGKQ